MIDNVKPLNNDNVNYLTLGKQKIYFFATEGGCWLCLGRYVTKDGYAQICWHGKVTLVHRTVYKSITGLELDCKTHVRHLCGNSLCMNPLHLTHGTAKQNAQDKIDQGRQPKGEQIPGSILTEKAVMEILKDGGRNIKRLAEKFNVGTGTIKDVLTGKTWAHVLPSIKRNKRIKRMGRMGNKSAEKYSKPVIDKELLKMRKPLN